MYHLGELSTDGFLNIASILKISKPVLGNFHLFSKRTIFLTVFCKVIITIIITPVSEEYREFTTGIYFAHIPVNSLLFLVYCNFDVVQNYRSTQGGKWALLPTTGLLSHSSIGHASTSVRNSPTILIAYSLFCFPRPCCRCGCGLLKVPYLSQRISIGTIHNFLLQRITASTK